MIAWWRPGVLVASFPMEWRLASSWRPSYSLPMPSPCLASCRLTWWRPASWRLLGLLCWCCVMPTTIVASMRHAGHSLGVLCDLPRPGTTTRHNDQATQAIDMMTRQSLPRHNSNDEKIEVFCRFSNHYMITIVMISTPLNTPKEIYYSPKSRGGL